MILLLNSTRREHPSNSTLSFICRCLFHETTIIIYLPAANSLIYIITTTIQGKRYLYEDTSDRRNSCICLSLDSSPRLPLKRSFESSFSFSLHGELLISPLLSTAIINVFTTVKPYRSDSALHIHCQILVTAPVTIHEH